MANEEPERLQQYESGSEVIIDAEEEEEEEEEDDVDVVDEEVDDSEQPNNSGAPEKPPQCQCPPVSVAKFVFGRERKLDDALPETVTKLSYKLESPACPYGDDQEQWQRAFQEATVYVIGTVHFSRESHADVMRVIEAVQPDVVMVELCPARLSILSLDEAMLREQAQNLTAARIVATIRQMGVLQGAMQVLLLSMSAHIARQLEMAPGGEFRAAHQAVCRVPGCRLVLGDRPIQITLQRALGALTFWQKLRFFWSMLTDRQPVTQEEVEKCKQKDLLEQLLSEMAADYPALADILVGERDLYMTNVLHSLVVRTTEEKRLTWLANNASPRPAWQPLVAVAVVGIGHKIGIEEHWTKRVDIAPLITVPPPSKVAAVVRFSFKLIFWGTAGYAVYRVARAVRARI